MDYFSDLDTGRFDLARSHVVIELEFRSVGIDPTEAPPLSSVSSVVDQRRGDTELHEAQMKTKAPEGVAILPPTRSVPNPDPAAAKETENAESRALVSATEEPLCSGHLELQPHLNHR